MQGFVILGVCAVIVQFTTEQMKKIVSDTNRQNWTQLLAAAIGIAVAFLVQTGLFQALGVKVLWEWLDYILTGIAFSGGAVAFNELVKLVSEIRPSNQGE